MISPIGPRRRLAICAGLVLGVGVALSAGPALAATSTPSPTPDYKVDVTVPAATGSVNATMHEFRLGSDGSLITSTPTLLPGQRVSLVWRGVPDGDWLGTLTAAGGAPAELGLVAASASQLSHDLTVPTGLPAGTYTVAFRLGLRELKPSFVFVVAASTTRASSGVGTTTTTTTTTSSGAKPASRSPAGKSTVAPAGSGAAGVVPVPQPSAQLADEPILSVSGVRSTYDAELNPFDGALDVTATVTNNGNVALTGALDVLVRGVASVVGRSAPQSLASLAPGESRELDVRVPDVEQAGLLRVELRLRPDPPADEPAVDGPSSSAAGGDLRAGAGGDASRAASGDPGSAVGGEQSTVAMSERRIVAMSQPSGQASGVQGSAPNGVSSGSAREGASSGGASSTGDVVVAPASMMASADRASVALPTVYREATAWAVPWSLLAVLMLLAGAIWFWSRSSAPSTPRVVTPPRWPGDPTDSGPTTGHDVDGDRARGDRARVGTAQLDRPRVDPKGSGLALGEGETRADHPVSRRTSRRTSEPKSAAGAPTEPEIV